MVFDFVPQLSSLSSFDIVHFLFIKILSKSCSKTLLIHRKMTNKKYICGWCQKKKNIFDTRKLATFFPAVVYFFAILFFYFVFIDPLS